MNLILIVSDTLRRDHLGCYGKLGAHTPALDRFARDAVVFDEAYSGSFPTLPCRAEIFTGKFVFTYLNWGPLPRSEVLLSETLAAAGYTCAMVTDNLPLCRSGYDYARGFHSLLRVRGQLYDNYAPLEGPVAWPCDPAKLGHGPDNRILQYLRNVAGREREEDYFAPRVIQEAIHWLEQNHRRSRFYLHVDIFDPHEPWDPPAEYVALHDTVGDGDDVIRPNMGPADAYSDADIRRMRALYAGEVTMVDRWLGRLFDTLDALGRREDTVVAFLSDHGLFLGERGRLGKLGKSEHNVKGWAPYWELSQIPLLIRAPGIAPARTRAFAHPGDVSPTLLQLAGVPIPPTMRTGSLVPVLRGEQDRIRDIAVSSWSLRGWSVHRPSVARTDEWSLVYWRGGVPPELYHRPTDPHEEHNVYSTHRTEARDVHRRYLSFIRAHGAGLGHSLPRSFGV